jgi:hypothetical protein
VRARARRRRQRGWRACVCACAPSWVLRTRFATLLLTQNFSAPSRRCSRLSTVRPPPPCTPRPPARTPRPASCTTPRPTPTTRPTTPPRTTTGCAPATTGTTSTTARKRCAEAARLLCTWRPQKTTTWLAGLPVSGFDSHQSHEVLACVLHPVLSYQSGVHRRSSWQTLMFFMFVRTEGICLLAQENLPSPRSSSLSSHSSSNFLVPPPSTLYLLSFSLSVPPPSPSFSPPSLPLLSTKVQRGGWGGGERRATIMK